MLSRIKILGVSALSMLTLAVSCKPEQEDDQQTNSITDLSGRYTLTYVGPDSRAIDSNRQEYCGGTYRVEFKEQGKRADEYRIYSQDSLHLFDTYFKDYIIIDNAQGTDTIAGYELINPSTYKDGVYGKADSLMIGDASIRYRSALFHNKYFLIHIAGKDYNNQKTYLRFER